MTNGENSSEVLKRIQQETERVKAKRRLTAENSVGSDDQGTKRGAGGGGVGGAGGEIEGSGKRGPHTPSRSPSSKENESHRRYDPTTATTTTSAASPLKLPASSSRPSPKPQNTAYSHQGAAASVAESRSVEVYHTPLGPEIIEASESYYFDDPVPANQMSHHLKNEHEAFKAR